MIDLKAVSRAARMAGAAHWDLLYKAIELKSFKFTPDGVESGCGQIEPLYLRFFRQGAIPILINSDLRNLNTTLKNRSDVEFIPAQCRLPLFRPAVKANELQLFDQAVAELRINQARKISNQIKELLRNQFNLNEIQLTTTTSQFKYFDSQNTTLEYTKTLLSIEVKILYQNQLFHFQEKQLALKEFNAPRFASRIVNTLNAVSTDFSSSRLPGLVILTPEVAATIISHFSGQLKTTRFFQKIIGPQFLTIFDRPQAPGLSGSVLFDDEGRQGETLLVEKGIFRKQITCTQNDDGSNSSANGFYRLQEGILQPEFTNLILQPQETAFNLLLKMVPEAIFVTHLRKKNSSGQRNFFSGYAYLIKNGTAEKNLKIFLEASFLSFFLKIKLISSDLKFIHHRFNIGSGYLLLEGTSSDNQRLVI